MADISNIPFRLVSRECGSSLLTSEEVDAHSFCLGIERSKRIASFIPEEHPIAMQLLGHDPQLLSRAARTLEDQGADIIDLNMGCPARKVTAKGQGAALMKDPAKAREIFQAMRKAIRVPFTVKIRGGWDDEHLNAVEIARLAESEGVDAITVHPRTSSQRFTGKAPWEIIADVARSVKIPVTGNGDVKSQEDAKRMMEQTGVQSVMIGRGALGQPWIFDPTFDSLDPQAKQEYRTRVIKRHRDLIYQYIAESHVLFQIKKHLVWYTSSIPGAAAIRHQIFLSKSPEDAWKIFEDSGIVELSPLA